MQFPLTMKQAEIEAPEAFVEIKKMKTTSKSKTSLSIPLNNFNWEFSVSERVESGGSFADMLRGSTIPKPKQTVDQRLEKVKGSLGITLHAWYRSQTFYVPVKNIPQRVLDKYREGYEKEDAEQKRFDSLTPAQREAEAQDALKDLIGTPGFTMIQIPVRKITK